MCSDGQVDKVFQNYIPKSLRKCSLAYARCQLSNHASDAKLLSSIALHNTWRKYIQ